MRIGVIGGGLFGCTAAILAARAGCEVHLLDKAPGLMLGATAATYSRVHRGYHYPRSAVTGRESRAAEPSFRAEYGGAVLDGGRQLYVVAPGSKVTVNQFRDFLDDESLPFSEEGGVFEVSEPRVHLGALQALVRQKVKEAGVRVHPGSYAHSGLRRHVDQIVVATYAGMNPVLSELGFVPSLYKFQVVERPLVLLPEQFRDTSIVVIDGPFGCVDPWDDTPLHVLGHVVHTIHAENTGVRCQVPGVLAPLIDRGLIRNPPVTRVKEVVEDLTRFIPRIREAHYVGSSFTIRAVLAHVEATDERPTIVTRMDPQVLSIMSGKLGTAVRAGQQAMALMTEPRQISAEAA